MLKAEVILGTGQKMTSKGGKIMKYPQNLKKGDTIGICAPSGGITKPEKQQRLDEAIKQLQEMDYKVIETESVRKEEKGRSTTAKKRAEEFMQLLENEEVKLIIFATGGDYLVEMLDYLDLEKIKTLEPKWMQGFSDITVIEFLLNTVLEVPSIYCDTIKSYAMKPLYRNLTDAIKIASGEKVTQKSFEKHEKVINDIEQAFAVTGAEQMQNPNAGYDLTEKVEWKNIMGEKKIDIQGRMIGGCLDCVQRFFGTKYDNINAYIEKYKQDGIIWYLECFEMSSPELTRILWQMKNAGYFEHVNGIIFGRPLFFREDYETSFNEAVKEVIGDLGIPIICDADIGHVAPQMAIVNGVIMKIVSENGKGEVYYDPEWQR